MSQLTCFAGFLHLLSFWITRVGFVCVTPLVIKGTYDFKLHSNAIVWKGMLTLIVQGKCYFHDPEKEAPTRKILCNDFHFVRT